MSDDRIELRVGLSVDGDYMVGGVRLGRGDSAAVVRGQVCDVRRASAADVLQREIAAFRGQPLAPFVDVLCFGDRRISFAQAEAELAVALWLAP
jgi:hypothetical protein